MDAAVQALVTHLDEGWDALLGQVGAVEESLFHWTPGPAFNSVAILLRHLRRQRALLDRRGDRGRTLWAGARSGVPARSAATRGRAAGG